MNIFVAVALIGVMQQAQDSLLATAAARGREFAANNPAPGSRTIPAAQQQHRQALALMDSARWPDAAMRLDVVARLDARNPAYRGDLGYALAMQGRWDEAAAAFEQATALQSRNAWYFVALGVARGAQERWLEAGGMLALAVTTDSAVIDRHFIAAIVHFYAQAGRAPLLLEWARLGTERYPEVAAWWLHVARTTHGTADSALGWTAIQRYRQLAPADPMGQVTYAVFASGRGEADSAVALAQRVVGDTAYRQVAVTIFYNAGVRAMQANDFPRASHALGLAEAHAQDSTIRQRSRYYLGFSDFNRAVTMLQAAQQSQNCAAAQAGDSVATLAERNIRASVALDSVNVTNTLTQSLPQLRQGVRNMIEAYCRGGRR